MNNNHRKERSCIFRRLNVLYLKVRSDGIAAAIHWLMTTVYNRAIPQKQVIWCDDISEIDSAGFSVQKGIDILRFYSIDQIDQSDFETLSEYGTDLMGSAGSILIRDRFAKGAVLWLIKVDGVLAGYRWTFNNDHTNPTYVPQTEKDVHSIGVELFPAFRGREMFNLFRMSMYITLKNEGLKRFYLETHLWNKRAVKAFLKTDTHKIGIATRFSIFGKNVVIWHDMTSKNDFL